MECPHCGAPLPRRAHVCKECGSDDRTGFRDSADIDYESTDLPEAYDPEAWEAEATERKRTRAVRLYVAAPVLLALAGLGSFVAGQPVVASVLLLLAILGGLGFILGLGRQPPTRR